MTDEEIAPAIIAEIVAAGIAGQTRQAPRESTIPEGWDVDYV